MVQKRNDPPFEAPSRSRKKQRAMDDKNVKTEKWCENCSVFVCEKGDDMQKMRSPRCSDFQGK